VRFWCTTHPPHITLHQVRIRDGTAVPATRLDTVTHERIQLLPTAKLSSVRKTKTSRTLPTCTPGVQVRQKKTDINFVTRLIIWLVSLARGGIYLGRGGLVGEKGSKLFKQV